MTEEVQFPLPSKDVFLDENILALAEADPIQDLQVPAFQADGKTHMLDENGQRKVFLFRLNRPNAGVGKTFSAFQRGKISRKGRIVQPSQQEVAIRAVRACLPDVRELTTDQVLTIIIRTGGYVGDNALLVNECMRMLGQNFDDQDDDEEKGFTENQIPS